MKTIIITGASSGIGRAVAQAFLDAGWTTGLIARSADKLAQITHANAVALPCDVTDEAAVQAAFDRFVGQTGRLDVLFNNAGMSGQMQTIDQISLADWKALIDLNLTGMFLAARAAFTQMKNQTPQGGRIINNGSISATTPRDGSIGYTTTKHGVTGMTKTLSLDGRAYDIAAGQIDIGNAETAMVADMNAQRVARGEAADPTMSVDEVAQAVLHMAGLPVTTNVLSMTIMANKMPFVGRG
ncbi:SDR family oxidoreductase [Yoonia sp. R2331]|uniref:SDR family oxidoreductase n=1 Tax=Yoonia sp. R2331 TaxID=3237238 RepID=UPI0034E4AA28